MPSIAVREVSAMSATPPSESAIPIAQREEISPSPAKRLSSAMKAGLDASSSAADTDVGVHHAADEHHLVDAVAEHAEGEEEQHLAPRGTHAHGEARANARRTIAASEMRTALKASGGMMSRRVLHDREIESPDGHHEHHQQVGRNEHRRVAGR